jgi:hypothetical protein
MPVSIDSNVTSGFFNEESSIKVAGNGPNYPIEPNSYADFGGDLKTVAREPISATRQRAKGTVTDLDVTAGWNEDYTQNNISRLLQGFLFADARCKPTNIPLFVTGNGDAQSGVVTPNGTVWVKYQISATAAGQLITRNTGSFITDGFKVGHIVKTRDFANAANNFVWNVTAVAANTLTLTPSQSMQYYDSTGVGQVASSALVNEAYAAACVEVVGFNLRATTLAGLDSADNDLGLLTLTCNNQDFTTFGFVPGEYVYIGDVGNQDNPGLNFIATDGTPVRGYARISAITAHVLTFDVSIIENFWDGGDAQTDANGYGVNLYFGTVIKNESIPSLIKRRTYHLYRTLGMDVNNEAIYEVITGAVPNQFSLNIPSNNKLTCDLSFIGMDSGQFTGDLGGNAPLNEEPYNTSQDMYSMLLYVIDTTQSQQVPLFGYATDEKITVNNNVKPNKAIGVVGGFEASVGMFDVSGTLVCYFDDEKAIAAVRNNADVGLVNVFAKKRQGMIFDLPLLTLGGGRLKIEKDKPIMADISHTAAAGSQNYTLLHTKFQFLPDSAMADYVAVEY